MCQLGQLWCTCTRRNIYFSLPRLCKDHTRAVHVMSVQPSRLFTRYLSSTLRPTISLSLRQRGLSYRLVHFASIRRREIHYRQERRTQCNSGGGNSISPSHKTHRMSATVRNAASWHTPQSALTFGASTQPGPGRDPQEPMNDSDHDSSWMNGESRLRTAIREAMLDSRLSRGGPQEHSASLPFAESCLARELTAGPDRVAESGPPKITLSEPTPAIRPPPPCFLSSSSSSSSSTFSPARTPPSPPPQSTPSRLYPPFPSSTTTQPHMANFDMAVATLSPVCSQSFTTKSPKSTLSHSPTPSVLSSSLQTVRYASEQGRRLAHRSRNSINRLLDCVMDNAAAFAESGSWHSRYSDIDHRIPFSIHSPTSGRPQGPSMTPRIHPRPKFFVCDEDEDEDEDVSDEECVEEDWASRSSSRFPSTTSSGGVIGHYDNDTTDIHFEGPSRIRDADEMPIKQHPAFPHISPSLNAGRRHSLLSDMLLAEKRLATQGAASRRPTNSTTSSWASTMLSSNSSSRCPGSGNSDGEISHAGIATGRHPLSSSQTSTHQSIQSNQRQGDKPFVHPCNRETALRRAKKSVFKNLDELVVKSSPLAAPSSAYQTPMSPTSSPISEETSFADMFPQPRIASSSSSSSTPAATTTSTPSSPPSPLKSLGKKQHNLPTLPSTINTCCCSPATATTTTAFATATSQCTTSASSTSAATVAAAAANSGSSGMNSGWTRFPPVQAQVHSFYGHLTSAIQRAISTTTTTPQ
ncbi:hypothetical protein B0O80DRAFT_55259 [Mortierella sp. GBAus27b]|nr:hypothetical protein B0O80DRAFT_55259 [Mortierella sp. GBAus27b]